MSPRPGALVSWIEPVRRGAAALGREALSALLPQLCPACGSPVGPPDFLCEACLARIPRLAIELCLRCLARGLEPVGCRDHDGFAVRPAWVYDERASLLVHALKYDGRADVAHGLGGELARAAAPVAPFDFVTEVPLHRSRRRERGYNQAERLARALAAAADLPYRPGVLARHRATDAQSRLGAARRRRNVAGAFRLEDRSGLEGRSLLLVDDVVTTGATLEECVTVLRRAGCRVTAVTLAWAQ
jgi:ComF family protein